MRRGNFRRTAARGGVAGAVEFNPMSISGGVFWVRADKGTTIATGVSQWNDQSGTGDSNKNLVQATGANQPTLVSADSTYNNKATLTFDGSNDNMASGTWASALAQPSTWIVIGHDGDVAEHTAIDGVVGHRNYLSRFSAPNSSFYAGTQVSGVFNWQTKGAVLCEFNGVSTKFFGNDFTTAAFSGNGGTNDLTALTVGSDLSGAQLWHGTIAEIIAYNVLLSQASKNLLRDYFNKRYGMTIV